MNDVTETEIATEPIDGTELRSTGQLEEDLRFGRPWHQAIAHERGPAVTGQHCGELIAGEHLARRGRGNQRSGTRARTGRLHGRDQVERRATDLRGAHAEDTQLEDGGPGQQRRREPAHREHHHQREDQPDLRHWAWIGRRRRRL